MLAAALGLSLGLVLSPTDALAAFPAEAGWQALRLDGSPVTDPIYDFSGSDAVDLVGETDRPAVAWAIDADDLSVRMRLEDDPRATTSTLRDLYGVLIDTNGDGADYECVIQLRSTGAILGVYANSSRDVGGWRDAPDAASSWELAAPLAGLSPRARVSPVGEGVGGFGGDEDWFLDLRVPRTALADGCGLDRAAPFSLSVATTEGGVSPYRLSTDLVGVDNRLGESLADGLSETYIIDEDGDGLSVTEEEALGTAPTLVDTDGDGLDDRREAQDEGTDPLLADTDGDGLDDGDELAAGSDPFLIDTDGDGATDGREVAGGTSPLLPDTDGDGIGDLAELDCDESDAADPADRDRDGLSDIDEGAEDNDRDDQPNWCDPDDDGDTIPSSVETDGDIDGDEIPNHLDTDADGDGTPDYEEGRADNDCDRLENWEDPVNEDGPCGDLDGDGLDNGGEANCGTDPYDPDTDDDGIPDGEEDCDEDSDGDGIPDPLDPDNGGNGGGGDGQGPDGTVNPLFALDDGKITGGACSTLPLSSAALPALLAALAAAARRRRSRALGASAALSVGGLAGLGGLGGAAHAQDLNGQTFRPALGEDRFLSVDDSENGPELVGAALWTHWAKDPLVWRFANGAEQPILESVTTMDLQAWGTVGPVRIGLDLPLHMKVDGYGAGAVDPGVLGDIRLDARAELIERGASPFGFAVGAHLQAPTGDGAAWVGEPSWTGGARAIGTYGNEDRLLSANLGLLFSQVEELPDDAVWGNRLQWGVGGATRFIGPVDAAAELVGARFLGSDAGAAATPLEAQLSLRGRPIDPLLISLGAGFGLTQGMGAPPVRLIAGISGHFGDRGGDSSGLTDAGPGRTPTHLLFIAEDGGQIAEAVFTIVSGPSSGRVIAPHEGPLVLHLKPGVYQFTADAEGFAPIKGALEVPAGVHHEQRIAMARIAGTCAVTLHVSDGEKRPLAAKVSGGSGLVNATTDPTSGVARFSLPAGGAHEFVVAADGYSAEHRAVACVRGEDGKLQNIDKDIILGGMRARLEGSKVIIMDKINFELNQARLKAEAKGVLDDVAAVLRAHPEIELLEIQGHTDLVGSAAYNLKLSQQRAEQVRDYLVRVHNVDVRRLKAKGYGENAPMVPGTGREADEANRRVEFHVLEQR
ncbi:MAG: OmpA family protein [Deltaproteobacteria bacterium]|nr:OmpA family protein [Deltaproteobacteria bacterium]